jgi:hypothetical protein
MEEKEGKLPETLMVKRHEAVLPEESAAVYTTCVVPMGNAPPLAAVDVRVAIYRKYRGWSHKNLVVVRGDGGGPQGARGNTAAGIGGDGNVGRARDRGSFLIWTSKKMAVTKLWGEKGSRSKQRAYQQR